MGNFVRPETDTIALTNGQSITVRRKLNAGERRAMFGRMYYPDTVRVDPMRVQLATMTAYLLDWTLKDDDGRLVPIAELPLDQLTPILDLLEPARFAEISTAIDTHAERLELGTDEKKDAGAIASSAI